MNDFGIGTKQVEIGSIYGSCFHIVCHDVSVFGCDLRIFHVKKWQFDEAWGLFDLPSIAMPVY